MKKITFIRFLAFLILLFSTTIGFSQTVFSGTPTLANACVLAQNDCTTSAVTIGEVYLGNSEGVAITSCTFGTPLIDVYIWVNVLSSTKENMYVQFDLFKNNNKIDINGAPYGGTQKISVGHVGTFSSGKYRIVAVPSYSCGEILEIKNLFMSWQVNSQSPPGCHKQNSMCNKDLLTSTIIVNTPIFANFSTNQVCNGGAFQQVTYTDLTTGGVANNVYAWSFPGAVTVSPTSLTTKGPYTVTYSSAGPHNASLTVSHPTNVVSPSIKTVNNITLASCCTIAINSITKTNIKCNGSSDGTVTATKTGGTGTITYDLLYSATSGGAYTATGLPTNGDSNGIYTGLGVGFYKVVVSEANGCSNTSSEVQITQPAALTAAVDKTNVTCNGANDGTITVTAPTGGYGT
ncbi:SprB repeat-containing protein, partial [Flavobacterium granuli]